MAGQKMRDRAIDKYQQWFFLVLVALWLVLSVVAPIVAFCLTRNPLCLASFADVAPPAYLLHRLANRIFPPSDNETMIAVAKRIGHKSKF